MPRIIHAFFRRDPSRDRHENDVVLEGYHVLWADGSDMTVGLDAFCMHGQRLLGLGRHLAGQQERFIDLLCFPLNKRDDDLTRLAGHRVRRFCLIREGRRGRLHFLDGTPTSAIFDLDTDDRRVLHWVGLSGLADGGELWLDLATRPAETSVPFALFQGFTGVAYETAQ
jgi:hypothetical protein